MSKTIRSQSQLFFRIFSNNNPKSSLKDRRIQNKMRTNLNNLRIVYGTALGEIPKNIDSLSLVSPAIFSMEQLGYFLDTAAQNGVSTDLSKADAAHFCIFLTQWLSQQQLLEIFEISNTPKHDRIHEEINTLQETLILFLDEHSK
ncbi:hypothetical protein [Tenuibacillus multivorans]|uniref:hypothetical protein n=1 Tax=Tenuibacillus multivorans TaxID=237069 RepID=UPI000B86AC5C|nr:hypothetical protein [Tenuibacillus multivorans]GEL76673.1 hypothetical protein TMU01_09080 [Tenuibacillus multivorans]